MLSGQRFELQKRLAQITGSVNLRLLTFLSPHQLYLPTKAQEFAIMPIKVIASILHHYCWIPGNRSATFDVLIRKEYERTSATLFGKEQKVWLSHRVYLGTLFCGKRFEASAERHLARAVLRR